ncbi:MAG: bifunctional metallophosphatase/5'-nucleotidase [Clostridia bacterium]|nr:bifunctional metallophosphatase/5'-nucleotidase [Clostridia bacterium]MBQ6122126.1 bifunctional metallophosphatase/5'-nucleotidase [Clostridia bacterium]
MYRKLTALILCLLMLTTSITALATKELIDNATVMIKTSQLDFSGKTVIIHSNDVHGAIDGYAYMAKCAQYVRDLGGEVILADAGDFSQGAPYVSLSQGHTAIEMMNAVGYDIATLGNHEFDFGYDKLMENLKDANFPVISANVYKDGKLILPATAILERGGLKIGFFGMETPETATKVNPSLISGISFSPFEQLYEAAQSAVDSLKAEGVDLIIGLWHLGIDDESASNGYRSSDVYEKVEGIDFVIDAHSHTVMTEDGDNNPIQSTGTRFATIGAVIIDNATGKIVDHYLLPTQYLKKDDDVDATAQEIISAVDEEYGAPFATTEVLLNGERDPGNRTMETNLGDLISDAMVWSVTREGGPEQDEVAGVVGITNGGGIRASIEIGEVSMKDVNTVLPFGNTVAVVYVKGSELLEALEASTFCTPSAIGGYPQTSGIEWTLDTTVEYDQGELYHNADGSDTSYYAPASIKRVTITAVNGEAFDPDATYAVVTNNFCAAGGDTYNAFMRAFQDGAGFDTGIPMDEAVTNYVTDVLDGKITAEAYGEPRGSETQILAE